MARCRRRRRGQRQQRRATRLLEVVGAAWRPLRRLLLGLSVAGSMPADCSLLLPALSACKGQLLSRPTVSAPNSSSKTQWCMQHDYDV